MAAHDWKCCTMQRYKEQEKDDGLNTLEGHHCEPQHQNPGGLKSYQQETHLEMQLQNEGLH